MPDSARLPVVIAAGDLFTGFGVRLALSENSIR